MTKYHIHNVTKNLVDLIKVIHWLILTWGDYSGLSGWPQGTPMSP